MTRASITFNAPNEAWIERELAKKEFATKTQFVNEMLRRERTRQEAVERLVSMLKEAEAEGIDPRPVPEIMQDIRARALKRLRAEGRDPETE